MKVFYIDGWKWYLSSCGRFVKTELDGEMSGWYRLAQFDRRFQAAASKAS